MNSALLMFKNITHRLNIDPKILIGESGFRTDGNLKKNKF